MWRVTYDMPTLGSSVDTGDTFAGHGHGSSTGAKWSTGLPLDDRGNGGRMMTVLGSYPRLVARLDEDGEECSVSTGEGVLTKAKRMVTGREKDALLQVSDANEQLKKAKYNKLIAENVDVLGYVIALDYLSKRGEELKVQLKLGDDDTKEFDEYKKLCEKKLEFFITEYQSELAKKNTDPRSFLKKIASIFPFPGKSTSAFKGITEKLRKMADKLKIEISDVENVQSDLMSAYEKAAIAAAAHKVATNPRDTLRETLQKLSQ